MDFVIYGSKLGNFYIEYEEEKVISLKKLMQEPTELGEKTAFTDMVFKQLEEYLEGNRKDFTFEYELRGTDFQKSVWKALLEIPYGETRTYKDIAIAVGNDKASRAVGMANNKNPIHIAVPCHRVVGANGKLVGYAGGIEMKEFLLNMEKGVYTI